MTGVSGRGWALLGLAALLYAGGANVGAGWVVLLAAALTGAVAVGWWRARAAARQLRVSLTVPSEVVAGGSCPVRLTITDTSAASVVATVPQAGLAGAGGRLEGCWTPGRGLHDLTVDVTVRDPLGVAVREVPTAATARVLAVPPVLRAEAALAGLVGPGGDRGRDDAEIAGLREHRPGDPARSVHWRASARRGELLVREHPPAAGGDTALALAAGTWPVGALDLATTVVASLAAAAAGRQVQVAADGEVAVWSAQVRRRLATLPPHAAAGPRALRDAPAPPGAVRVAPAGATAITVAGRRLDGWEGVRAWLDGS